MTREWLCGRYTLTTPIAADPGGQHADALLWLELPGRALVESVMFDPREPAPFAETFENATMAPAVGDPRRPDRIRVPTTHMMKALRDVAAGIPIVVAPVPEVDEVFAELDAVMTADARPPSYLGDGSIPVAAIAELFETAMLLFRAAPWRVAVEEQIIRLDAPALELEGAVISIIGSLDESHGLLLFSSLEDYLNFGEQEPAGPQTREVAVRSLSFSTAQELPPTMLQEVHDHTWPVAGPRAYPALLVVDPLHETLPVEEEDVRIMTLCTRAFLAFFERHHALYQSETGTVHEDYTIGDVTVTITAPFAE
jgi:hypothetical protein